MSVCTFVDARPAKAPWGSRIAPSSSAWEARYSRTASVRASIVPVLVMKHTSPSGRTRSSARPKK